MPTAGANLVEIGRALKPDGTDGLLTLTFHRIDAEEIKGPVYIYRDGLPVPYFISELSQKGGRCIARLTDIVSLEDALEISGEKLYVAEDVQAEGLQEDLSGWTLVDASQGGVTVGTIVGIEPIPGNPCIEVDCGQKETALVPLNENLVTDMDFKSHTLTMNIPEGLLNQS